MSDIVERLRKEASTLGENDEDTKIFVHQCGIMREAANEIAALCSRLEQAEKERDDLRDRVNFTLTDHQRLLQRSDIESTCDTPDLCFAEGGPVRCGPCAIRQSRNEGVACLDWLPFSPEQYRLKRRAEAAEKALAEARNAAFKEAEMPDSIDAHENPRYTTRRLHYEIDKAKKQGRNEALEEAARIVESMNPHIDQAEASGWAIDTISEIAAAIRAKVTP